MNVIKLDFETILRDNEHH